MEKVWWRNETQSYVSSPGDCAPGEKVQVSGPHQDPAYYGVDLFHALVKRTINGQDVHVTVGILAVCASSPLSDP